MTFVIDEQLPAVLCQWLRDRGLAAFHVADLGLSSAEDPDIWSIVSSMGAAPITKDEDFVSIRLSKDLGPAVVWLRIGNATNPALFAWLAPRLDAILAAIARGETIIEVR